ncbi:sigma-70 family RNA polymerase sigma factor [Brevibacillus sp. NRS-1366]|uniref:sigma-70 family RNA polymerase sigma factor n=1 Tax=Brevibacillus sp. NRS-1366 TaxID=3233899 RepID=UPI003D234372
MNEQMLDLWLDKLIAGDQEAFEVVYSMTSKKIYGTVAAMVSNKEDVHDIVSEIYCQLWRALPSYDRKRPFLLWVNGIVIRQVKSWRRQIWRRFRLLERKNRLGEKPHVEMPDEPLLETESSQEMQRAIMTLPFKLRSVIIYRFYFDYSYDEIAELLQIPIGTAKSRNHLALKRIRAWFDTELNGEELQECLFQKK